jgi:Ulp1 family protease
MSFYFFTSFLYSKLADQGARETTKWTRKLDLFAYKFLFIPICEACHWSLCIAVNPKVVALGENDTASCGGIVFLDSKKLHNAARIKSNIHQWLNAEWTTRLDVDIHPFNARRFPLIEPNHGKYRLTCSTMNWKKSNL